jgi:HECT-domain (ubiquitin-transferase)
LLHRFTPHVQVTNANKREYVDLVARHRMTNSIRPQIDAFLHGFWEVRSQHLVFTLEGPLIKRWSSNRMLPFTIMQVVARELVSLFNDHELELLISGLPEIDVDDLRANTEYQGFSPTSPVITWFWEVVREMDAQDLALLMQFVTGTSKVPLEGFKALQGVSGPQKFQIHKAYGPPDRLPSGTFLGVIWQCKLCM